MHIIPFKGRNRSGAFDLNYLYKTGKVYIMDNHLAAGWCWLQEINTGHRYNLFHIDRHYDLMASQVPEWVAALEAIDFDYRTISIEELIAIPFTRPDNPSVGAYQLFRWDNYITILDAFYPGIWNVRSFATHKDGDIPDGYEVDLHEPRCEDLPTNLGYWIGERKKCETVLNLDMDYFFYDYNGKYFQLFTDSYIKIIAKEIASAWENIAVVTIALSPECCGGWDNAERVAKLIMNEWDIPWLLA